MFAFPHLTFNPVVARYLWVFADGTFFWAVH